MHAGKASREAKENITVFSPTVKRKGGKGGASLYIKELNIPMATSKDISRALSTPKCVRNVHDIATSGNETCACDHTKPCLPHVDASVLHSRSKV